MMSIDVCDPVSTYACVCVCVSALVTRAGRWGGEWTTGQVVEGGGEVFIAAAQPVIKEKQRSQQEAEGQ